MSQLRQDWSVQIPTSSSWRNQLTGLRIASTKSRTVVPEGRYTRYVSWVHAQAVRIFRPRGSPISLPWLYTCLVEIIKKESSKVGSHNMRLWCRWPGGRSSQPLGSWRPSQKRRMRWIQWRRGGEAIRSGIVSAAQGWFLIGNYTVIIGEYTAGWCIILRGWLGSR